MLVRKAQRIDVECVVRGYLAGSGWREYRRTGSVCGIRLSEGLREVDMVGEELARELRDRSIALYEKARTYAEDFYA